MLFRITKAFLLIVVVVTIAASIARYNLVIPLSNRQPGIPPKVTPGQELQLFKNYDFTKGDWSAYLVIKPEDFTDLHPMLAKRVCWKTTDRDVLNQMKQRWKFKIAKDADMATVGSTFYLVKDGVIVFESGLVLDKNIQGLQNETFGWMGSADSNSMIDVCRMFKKQWAPIVFI